MRNENFFNDRTSELSTFVGTEKVFSLETKFFKGKEEVIIDTPKAHEIAVQLRKYFGGKGKSLDDNMISLLQKASEIESQREAKLNTDEDGAVLSALLDSIFDSLDSMKLEKELISLDVEIPLMSAVMDGDVLVEPAIKESINIPFHALETYERAKKLEIIFAQQGMLVNEGLGEFLQKSAEIEGESEIFPELLQSYLTYLDTAIEIESHSQKTQEQSVSHELTEEVLASQEEEFQMAAEKCLSEKLQEQISFMEKVIQKEPFNPEEIVKFSNSAMGHLDMVFNVVANIIKKQEKWVRELEDIPEYFLQKFKMQQEIQKDFIGTFRHDYRGVFGNIFSFSSLINGEDMTEDIGEGKEWKNRIKKLPKQLREVVVERMLLIQPPVYEKIDIASILEEGMGKVDGNIKNKKIKVIPHNVEAKAVFSDKARMRVWLHNFITNAIKFTPENGEIIIDVKELENGFTKISVRDAGEGMAKEKVEELSQIFSGKMDSKNLVSTKGTNGEKGSGKGLINCNKLANRVVGIRLAVASREGEGATFSCLVPTTEEQYRVCLQEGINAFKEGEKNTQSYVYDIIGLPPREQ